MEEHLDTGIFGAIAVVIEDCRVVVAGDEIPTVELVNTGSQRRPDVPIGTRTAAELRWTVDGRPCPIQPGPGKYRRGTYRVVAGTPSGTLLFTPSSAESHRLVRGERLRWEHELGYFTRHPEGTVLVEWKQDATVAGVTATAPRPEPVEVAVGYALALGFGTGAQLFLGAMVSALDRLFPG